MILPDHRWKKLSRQEKRCEQVRFQGYAVVVVGTLNYRPPA